MKSPDLHRLSKYGQDARNRLSERQEELLRLAGDGLGDKEIARELGVAEGTVRTYWERMRKKMGAQSRGEIIARILREEYNALRSEYDVQKLLLKTLPCGAWVVTSGGQFEFWSDWFMEFGGARPAEIARRGCRALMPAEDLGASATRWSKAVATGTGYDAVVRFIRASDQTLHLHNIRIFPLRSSDGRIEKWCGSAQQLALGNPED